ncbi:MAG: hypothetical protein BWY70_00565 [Bacteroidetes bacterium ADurb.Bin408]|nr:MAG: hypothetical protein BWY70_00565 [Bacteroidetes bacterium ADurb.Bin408]
MKMILKFSPLTEQADLLNIQYQAGFKENVNNAAEIIKSGW